MWREGKFSFSRERAVAETGFEQKCKVGETCGVQYAYKLFIINVGATPLPIKFRYAEWYRIIKLSVTI